MKISPIDRKVILASSFLAIIAGILFCALREDLLYILFTIMGAFIIVSGIIALFKRSVFGGIFSIAVGVLLILGAWFFVNVLLLVNGILLCISGFYGIFVSILTRDLKNLVFSILTVVVGVLFFIYTEQTAGWIFFVIGALFIVLGIVGLIMTFTSNKDKKIKEVNVKEVK